MSIMKSMTEIILILITGGKYRKALFNTKRLLKVITQKKVSQLKTTAVFLSGVNKRKSNMGKEATLRRGW